MVERILGEKVIGIKQSTKAIQNGGGRILYIAEDADMMLINPLIGLAKEKNIDIKSIETMKKLGKMCGIEVKAATALVLE